METTFINRKYREEGKQQTSEFLKSCKLEDDMNASAIKEIITSYYRKEGYIINMERAITHSNPMDIVVGKITHYNRLERNLTSDEIEIIGLEIKGDNDNFMRLENQIEMYSKICDKVFVILHKKELKSDIPKEVGILRVSEKGSILEERYAYSFVKEFNLSLNNAEYQALMLDSGLGKQSSIIIKMLEILPKVWKKVVFNRLFGEMNYSSGHFDKMFPLSEEELQFLVGIQIDYQLNVMKKKARELKRLAEAVERFVDITDQKTLEKVRKQADFFNRP